MLSDLNRCKDKGSKMVQESSWPGLFTTAFPAILCSEDIMQSSYHFYSVMFIYIKLKKIS